MKAKKSIVAKSNLLQSQKSMPKLVQSRKLLLKEEVEDENYDPQFLAVCEQVNCNYQHETPIIIEAIKTVVEADLVRQELA